MIRPRCDDHKIWFALPSISYFVKELVAVTKNGKRLKVKFGLGGSDTRCSTPNKHQAPSDAESMPAKQLLDHQPSTSKASAPATVKKIICFCCFLASSVIFFSGGTIRCDPVLSVDLPFF